MDYCRNGYDNRYDMVCFGRTGSIKFEYVEKDRKQSTPTQHHYWGTDDWFSNMDWVSINLPVTHQYY